MFTSMLSGFSNRLKHNPWAYNSNRGSDIPPGWGQQQSCITGICSLGFQPKVKCNLRIGFPIATSMTKSEIVVDLFVDAGKDVSMNDRIHSDRQRSALCSLFTWLGDACLGMSSPWMPQTSENCSPACTQREAAAIRLYYGPAHDVAMEMAVMLPGLMAGQRQDRSQAPHGSAAGEPPLATPLKNKPEQPTSNSKTSQTGDKRVSWLLKLLSSTQWKTT